MKTIFILIALIASKTEAQSQRLYGNLRFGEQVTVTPNDPLPSTDLYINVRPAHRLCESQMINDPQVIENLKVLAPIMIDIAGGWRLTTSQ